MTSKTILELLNLNAAREKKLKLIEGKEVSVKREAKKGEIRPIDLSDLIIGETQISMKPLYSVNKHGKNQGWGTYLKLFKEGNKNGECKIKNKYWTSKMDKKYYAVIYTAYGIIGGKIQTTSKEITVGKNIGRANETNVLSQAVLEMKSMWTHQVERKGYMDKINKSDGKSIAGEESTLKIGSVRPMLLGKYEPGKVKFPACIETKYDGMRCLAHYENDKVILSWRCVIWCYYT